MIDGADWLCEQHFGKNLIDKDVDILDPATGTGRAAETGTQAIGAWLDRSVWQGNA